MAEQVSRGTEYNKRLSSRLKDMGARVIDYLTAPHESIRWELNTADGTTRGDISELEAPVVDPDIEEARRTVEPSTVENYLGAFAARLTEIRAQRIVDSTVRYAENPSDTQALHELQAVLLKTPVFFIDNGRGGPHIIEDEDQNRQMPIFSSPHAAEAYTAEGFRLGRHYGEVVFAGIDSEDTSVVVDYGSEHSVVVPSPRPPVEK